MPIYFPQINANAIVTQRPYTSGRSFSTIFQDNPTGIPTSFVQYGGGLTNFPTGPLGRFNVNYPVITDAEIQTLLVFFRDVAEGRLQGFIFLDPGGNLVASSEDFSVASWTAASVSVSTTGLQLDPYRVNNRAQVCTSTGSNGTLSAVVLPAGGASGMSFTASVWAKASSLGQPLAIGFAGLASQTYALTTGWTRITCSVTLATTSVVTMVIGGASTWAGTAIQLFGAQCVPGLGPGAYRKTPGSNGYRAKCRFDTDAFAYRQNGPNENALALPIQETF